MKRLLYIGLGVLFVSPLAPASTLYKWVDADGTVHYTDRPPPSGAGKVEARSLGGEPPPPPDAGRAALEAAVARNPITLYSIPRCSACDLARLYLTRRNVPFTEKNVSAGNDANQKEMIQKIGELIVPTITVGTRVMKGAYVESLLESELELAGYPGPESDKAREGSNEATGDTDATATPPRP